MDEGGLTYTSANQELKQQQKSGSIDGPDDYSKSSPGRKDSISNPPCAAPLNNLNEGRRDARGAVAGRKGSFGR